MNEPRLIAWQDSGLHVRWIVSDKYQHEVQQDLSRQYRSAKVLDELTYGQLLVLKQRLEKAIEKQAEASE